MENPAIVVRLEPGLRKGVKAAAEEEGRHLSEVVRSALLAYVTGQDGNDAYDSILARARKAEAEAARLRAALEACRSAAAAETARKARAALAAGREDLFVTYLQASSRDHPATPKGAAVASGFSYRYCRNILDALGAAGYAEKLADGRYAPVPGADVPAGIREANAAHYAARAPRSRREGSSPAHVRPAGAGEATGPPEGNSAARKEEPRKRIAAVREQAAARGLPLVAASELKPGTAVFLPAGADEPVVPVHEVPEMRGKP